MRLRTKIQKAMKKHAEFGQLHTNDGATIGGWFVWLMDAVDVTEKLMENSREKRP